MSQAEERLPLQTTSTAAQYLFQEIRKFTNLLPGKDDEAARRFLTIAMQVLSQKPDLLRKCGRVSVLNCLIECARLRLDPEGALGHAYLIPYKNQCTVQIGYKGFCQLVYRQDIKKVWTDAVFPADEFNIVSGDRPRLYHKLDIEADEDRESDLDAILGAYACIILPSGETDFEWMNLASIKKTRGKSSAWEDWPIEMAKIRPLKRLLKRQKTTDTTLNHGMALDDRDGVPRDPKLEAKAEVIEVQDSGLAAALEKVGENEVQDALAPGSRLVQEKTEGAMHVTPITRKDKLQVAPETQNMADAIVADARQAIDKKPLEGRKAINARIEKLWYDFHKAKIPDGALEMDRELNDYTDPDQTSDAEAWQFADKLARALLVAGAASR